MKLLLTSDLHLTSRPADNYRWALFPWLVKQALNYKVDAVAILGDLTDAKDRHSAELVNRVMDSLALLAEEIEALVIILVGNHDAINPQCPFFGMSQYIGYIRYVKEKQIIQLAGRNILAVPFHRGGIQQLQFSAAERACDILLAHETFSGAVASNGIKLEGISQKVFKKFQGPIFSGDIHVPQQLERVTYVGAPYRIRFNDTFEPRVLLYNKGEVRDLHFPCLQRHTVVLTDPGELRYQEELQAGDQVKVRLSVPRSQYSEWSRLVEEVKAIGKELELEIHGIELNPVVKRQRVRLQEEPVKPAILQPTEVVKAFCAANQIDTYRQEIGEALL